MKLGKREGEKEGLLIEEPSFPFSPFRLLRGVEGRQIFGAAAETLLEMYEFQIGV